MANPSIVDMLQALAQSDQSRSETARLRDIMDDVEKALDAGVTRSAVLDALHKQGFSMTLRGFESALYRLRKRRLSKQAISRFESTTPAVGTTNLVTTGSPPPTQTTEPTSPRSGFTPKDLRAASRRDVDLDTYLDSKDK